MKRYLSGFDTSLLKEVVVFKLDARRLKTFPDWRLINHGRDEGQRFHPQSP
jgi:hypothetical protein